MTLGDGSEWRPSEVEIWSSDRVRQRPRLGDGVGVAGRRLALLSPSSGLADGVADVFCLSILQALFFLVRHHAFTPSWKSSLDAKTSREWDHGTRQNSRKTSSISASKGSPLQEPKARNVASATY